MPNQNVRSLLTSFCVNLCHLIMSLQQSVIQSVSPVLSGVTCVITNNLDQYRAIAWACCIRQVHLRM
ncbi:hypothetical protein [Coleofasciculus chthonoplastes]|uniref:hypothetical protein n=1 Tax=Coleofasciculus chthonoplastes TaxID=64178 RepID=UPI0032F0F03B